MTVFQIICPGARSQKRLELFSLLNLNKVQVTFVGRINGEAS